MFSLKLIYVNRIEPCKKISRISNKTYLKTSAEVENVLWWTLPTATKTRPEDEYFICEFDLTLHYNIPNCEPSLLIWKLIAGWEIFFQKLTQPYKNTIWRQTTNRTNISYADLIELRKTISRISNLSRLFCTRMRLHSDR